MIEKWLCDGKLIELSHGTIQHVGQSYRDLDGNKAWRCYVDTADNLLDKEFMKTWTPTKDILQCAVELLDRGFVTPIFPSNQYMIIAAYLVDPEMEVPLYKEAMTP